jgi:CRP-like cAMP-binding protein
MFYETINNLPDYFYSRIEEISLPANKILIHQEGELRYLYMVKKGSVKVYHTNEKGQEFLFGLFGQGEFFGELEYFTNTNYFSSVETISECTVLRFTKELFKEILETSPALFALFCSSISFRLLKISQRSTEASYYPLEVLLAKFLDNEIKDNKTSEVNVIKENLAGYFGTNVRSINRILKKFSDNKIITINGSRIEIINPVLLQKIFYKY